jgi:uncharacterized membrane-anchored protein YjiN (DUF445 family)
MDKKEKKSRYLAGISLAIMGFGFLLTIPFQDTLTGKLLQGAFEAGLVGGLADWFAVTALFRHPLGIPIPHTALLPKKRERLTQALVRMLEKDWLTVASIMDKIRKINFTDKILMIVSREIQNDYTKKVVHSLIQDTLLRIDFKNLAPLLEKEMKGYLLEVDASRLLKSVADGIVDRKYDEAAFNYILEETGKWASTEEAKYTMGKVGKQLIETTEADGLLKFAIQSFNQMMNEERIGQMMQTFILNRIKNVSKPDNRYRTLILEWIRKELVGIENREKLMVEINEWKNKLVNDIELEDHISSLLETTKERILLFVAQEDFVDHYINPVVLRYINAIKEDDEKMSSIETWLHNQVATAIENNHSKIGMLVKENLDKLDTETLIDMMENNIGKDIQWIRVNGAVCGFFIGLCLTIFKLVIY